MPRTANAPSHGASGGASGVWPSPGPPGHRIKTGYLLPSAAYTIARRQIRAAVAVEGDLRTGDVLYVEVERLGHHRDVVNKRGRAHRLATGARLVGVVGSRYAPDEFEVVVPQGAHTTLDLASRGGVLGQVVARNSAALDPTRVRVIGRVTDADGLPLNTLDFPLIPARAPEKGARSKLILVCGTSMNAGKTTVAAACCWALSGAGRDVRASKLTGTANVNDILRMNDAGASSYCDFSYLGYPSTYRLRHDELMRIFESVDAKHAADPRAYWVVELADGILQRETAMLLETPGVQERLHRLIFSARDTFGALGGIAVLKDRFGLVPDAISGMISASPLLVRELAACSDVPVVDSAEAGLEELCRVLL